MTVDVDDVAAIAIGGGVEAAGDSFLTFFIDFSASSKGFIDDGCEMLESDSFLIEGVGAFLKLGSFGFGFGAEKNDESDLASLTSLTADLTSFLMTEALDDETVEGVLFFKGGADFEAGASALRFLPLPSRRIA